MAKKKLSTEEKIRKYKSKRRMILSVKIAIAVAAVLLLIPATYYGYYFTVFSIMPRSDYDPDKILGTGFSRPLHMIHEDSVDSDFILAYYYHDCWNVVEDSKKIVESRNDFTVYKKDEDWHKGTHLQLILIKDKIMYDSLPLSEFTLIDSRCFKDCTKKMTMEEFKKYIADNDLQSVYLFD